MTGRLSLSRMILVFLLPRTCAAVPHLFHTMGSHRAGSGVCLGVHLGHVGPKTLSTVTALTPLELARPSVRILCTVVPFMLFYSPSREASSAELTLGILGGRRFHFPMSVIQCPHTRPRAVAPWHALCCQDEAAGDRPVRGTVTNESEPMRVHVFNALEDFEQRIGGGCLCPQGTARTC